MDLNSSGWLNAQTAVLGAALISPETVPKILERTRAEDYSGTNKLVYQAIRAVFMADQPIDPVTVLDRMGKQYGNYLMQLMDVTPTAAHIDTYISLCRKQAKAARLQELGAQLQAATEPDALNEIVNAIQLQLVDSTTLDAWDAKRLYADFFARHSAPLPEHLPWVIPEMERDLFCERGDLLYLAGAPSAGKTAFALQCAWAWADKYRVGFFSLETKAQKLYDRQIAADSGVQLGRLKRNQLSADDWQRITDQHDRLQAKKMQFFRCRGALTVAEIKAAAQAYRLDVVIIDYIQLLAGKGYNDYERVTNISMDLHRFAQSGRCYVIGLSQLARQDKTKSKYNEPDMSALRSSGQLEQDADAILMLYMANDTTGQRALKCAKNKEGETFRIVLDFDGRTQKFAKSRKTYKDVQAELNRQKREERAAEKFEESRQLTMLPPETPTPFDAGSKKKDERTEKDENNCDHER